MPNTVLNQMELQSLRHLMGEELLTTSKCRTYAQQCKDQQLQAQVQKCAQEHQERAQQLIQLLS